MVVMVRRNDDVAVRIPDGVRVGMVYSSARKIAMHHIAHCCALLPHDAVVVDLVGALLMADGPSDVAVRERVRCLPLLAMLAPRHTATAGPVRTGNQR